MDEESILKRLKEDVINFDIDDIREVASLAVQSGIPTERIITEALSKGMEVVDERYRKDEYFLPDLVMAGEAMNEATKIIFSGTNKLQDSAPVVLATVKGDIHDIGKNILSNLLNGAGIAVYDLGIDVDRNEIVETVRRLKPRVLGLSSMVTTTREETKGVIEALESNGLRKDLKVIIGGEATGRIYSKMVGADASAKDAVEGVRIIKRWIQNFDNQVEGINRNGLG